MSRMFDIVFSSTIETLEMVFFSTVFSVIIGLPLGIILQITDTEEHGGLKLMLPVCPHRQA